MSAHLHTPPQHKKYHWQARSHEQLVRLHGPYELEFKLVHSHPTNEALGLDIISFVPPGLQIPQEYLDPTIAMGAIKSYIRKFTPNLDFNSSADQPGHELAELFRLKEILSRGPAEGDPARNLLQQYKIYATAYRKFVKAQIHELVQAPAAQANSTPVDPTPPVTLVLQLMRDNWLHYRRWWQEVVRLPALQSGLPTMTYIDQYISDEFNLFLLRALEALDPRKADSAALRGSIAEILKVEAQHRNKCGYPPFVASPKVSFSKKNMSSHLYIHSLTRKMVDSVLYLTARPETNTSADSQWFAVIAATLAMSIYLIPLIAFQLKFGLDSNTSFWVLLAILLYIIKDRVKESIRDTLRRKRSKKMAHRTMVISDEGAVIGKTYEKLSYPLQNELPDKLLDIRFTGQHADLQRSLGGYEHIQYYQKLQELKNLPSRNDTLVEIIRMDLQSWLQKADGNQQNYSQYHDKADEVRAEKILRTYHFHILVRFGTSTLKHDELLRYHKAEGEWQHLRVVASRERILEIQPLPAVSII